MEEKNAVVQLMEGLLEKADDLQLHYKNNFYALSDPQLPLSAGVSFLRGQIRALVEASKAPVPEV